MKWRNTDYGRQFELFADERDPAPVGVVSLDVYLEFWAGSVVSNLMERKLFYHQDDAMRWVEDTYNANQAHREQPACPPDKGDS